MVASADWFDERPSRSRRADARSDARARGLLASNHPRGPAPRRAEHADRVALVGDAAPDLADDGPEQRQREVVGAGPEVGRLAELGVAEHAVRVRARARVAVEHVAEAEPHEPRGGDVPVAVADAQLVAAEPLADALRRVGLAGVVGLLADLELDEVLVEVADQAPRRLDGAREGRAVVLPVGPVGRRPLELALVVRPEQVRQRASGTPAGPPRTPPPGRSASRRPAAGRR